MEYSPLCDGTHKEIGFTAPWYWGGALETGSIKVGIARQMVNKVLNLAGPSPAVSDKLTMLWFC